MSANRFAAVVAFGVFLTGTTSAQTIVPPRGVLPSWELIEARSAVYFEELPGREPKDLLSRSDVEPLFDVLASLRWDVADREDILKLVLSDTDWLVKVLRTKRGKKFMRGFSQADGSYDRIDRMRRLPDGKRQILQLISEPGGYTLFEFLATTKLGQGTGRLLSKAPKGKNFNEPTKRLYTSEDVMKQLKLSYEAELERRKKLGTLVILPATPTAPATNPPASSEPTPAPSPQAPSPEPADGESAPSEE